jgi:hypothetical protein
LAIGSAPTALEHAWATSACGQTAKRLKTPSQQGFYLRLAMTPLLLSGGMDVYQRRRLVALSAIAGVFVLIVVVIASAGGDDEPEAPITTVGGATGQTAAAIPKDQYIDEADSICGEVNSALASIDAADEAEAAAEEADLLASELQQLQSLSPPDEDEDLANDFLRALQDQVNAAEDRQVAIDRQDDTALDEIEGALDGAEVEAQAAAEDFGFDVCGNPEATGAETDAETGAGGAEPAPAAPVEPAPVEPAPTEPAPTAPPADGGTGGGGGGGGGTGGVSP